MWLLIVSFLCCFSGGAQANYWQDPPFDLTQDAIGHNVTWLAGKLFIPENLPLNSSIFNLYYNDSYGSALSISMDCAFEFAEYDASKILYYTKEYDFEEVTQSLFINFLVLGWFFLDLDQ